MSHAARRMLRLAARAHPLADRATVLALAEDLVADGASPVREAAGLLGGGLCARVDLRPVELPLAGLLTAAMTLGALRGGLTWTAGVIGALLVLSAAALVSATRLRGHTARTRAR